MKGINSPMGALSAFRSRDPAMRYAEALLQSSTSTAPVQSNTEGLARMGKALVGGWLANRQNSQYQDDMAKVLAGAEAKPWVNPDTGSATIPEYQAPGTMGPPKLVPTAPAGVHDRMLAAWKDVKHPDVQDFLRQIALSKVVADQQEAADARKTESALANALALKAAPGYEPSPTSVKEYKAAKADGYTGSYEDWMKTNATGKDVPMTVKEWQYYNTLPKDQQAQFLMMKRATPYLNLGGQMVQPDPVSPGRAMGSFDKTLPPEDRPENKAAQKAATIAAESGAKAAIDLPKVEAQAKGMLDLLNKVESHPGFSTVVGAPGLTGIPAKMGLPIPGTEAADFTVLLDQIKGKQFLEAFETLKGGGQITEVEGRKATEAMARMNTAQSENEFKAALQEFKGIVQQGVERAKQKAAPQTRRAGDNPASPKTEAEYNALPSDSIFTAPDGTVRRKP
jgi:hypothetical protein